MGEDGIWRLVVPCFGSLEVLVESKGSAHVPLLRMHREFRLSRSRRQDYIGSKGPETRRALKVVALVPARGIFDPPVGGCLRVVGGT